MFSFGERHRAHNTVVYQLKSGPAELKGGVGSGELEPPSPLKFCMYKKGTWSDWKTEDWFSKKIHSGTWGYKESKSKSLKAIISCCFALNLLFLISRHNMLVIVIDMKCLWAISSKLKIQNFVLFVCKIDDCGQTTNSHQYSLLWQYVWI